MKTLKKLHQDSQGFTLVELMIVVAIIGILAAIAIPQFAQYRIRGFNTSALSDCKNAVTSQAALTADWQRLGTSLATAGGAFTPAAPTTGDAVDGGDANGDGLATVDNSGAAGANRGTPISVGNGITLFVHAPLAPTFAIPASTYQAVSKHLSGDTVFANDADSPNVYQNVQLLAPAVKLTVVGFTGSVAANTTGVDNIQPVANWVAK